jgi:hypothetical protein
MAWMTGEEIKKRQEIEKKVDERIREKEFRARALSVNVCYLCGGDAVMDDELNGRKCEDCGKVYMS